MSGADPIDWACLTWPEIPAALAACDAAALLPVGATEQHGPHLGCGTDTIIAERLCRDVSARTGTMLLPTLPYGCSLGHSRRWPGTIALDPLLLAQLVTQIGDWAYESGVRRLFIVNAHVTNAAPLRCALELLRAKHDALMVAVINTAEISARVRAAHFADAADWHANAAETALLQVLSPAAVRPELCAEADDPDRTEGCVFAHPVNRTSENGVTGYPSRATAAQGRDLYAAMIEDLSALVMRGRHETPPLPHGYAQRAPLSTATEDRPR